MRRYTLLELEQLPTISSAQGDDLKIRDYDDTAPGTDGVSVWLSRDSQSATVTVEHLRNGRWILAETYMPEFPELPERLAAEGVRLVSLESLGTTDEFIPGCTNAVWRAVIGKDGTEHTVTCTFTGAAVAGMEPPTLPVIFDGALSAAGDWINANGDLWNHLAEFGGYPSNASEADRARVNWQETERLHGEMAAMLGDLDMYIYLTEKL